MSRKLLRPVDTAHPFAATARHRLDENGIANLCGGLLQPLQRLRLAVKSRHNRNSGLLHQSLCGILEPHGPNGRSGRADPDQARLLHRLGKVRIF